MLGFFVARRMFVLILKGGSVNGQQHLIISIKETRKLLGKEGEHLTDDQIEHLIITLTELSSILLNQIMVPKNPQVEV